MDNLYQYQSITGIDAQASPELDHKAMWARLRADLDYCVKMNVPTLHPVVVLCFMSYIEQEYMSRTVGGGQCR